MNDVLADGRATTARFATILLAGLTVVALYPVWLFGAGPVAMAALAAVVGGYGLSLGMVRKGSVTLGVLFTTILLLGQYVALGLVRPPLGPAPFLILLPTLLAAATLPSRWLWVTFGLTLTAWATRGWWGGLGEGGGLDHALAVALASAVFAISLHRTRSTERALTTAGADLHADFTDASDRERNIGEYHRLIAEHTDDLLALLDAKAWPIYLSASHARLFGQPVEELMSATFERLVAPDNHDEFSLAFSKAWNGEKNSAEIDLCGQSGILRTFDVQLTRVEGRAEPLVALTARDITERKQLQQRLLASERMESLSRLAGSVAHDFNNLLMVIGGASEMARHTVRDIPEAVADLDSVLEATHNASKLTRQLLTFSRKQVVTLAELDIAEGLFGIREFLERLVGKKVEVVFDFAQNCPKVMIAAAHLEQLAMDLAMNARDAMPDGGRVTFTLRPIEIDQGSGSLPALRFVELTVQDQGTGIPEDLREHIFEPLFTTKGDTGTGLGLPTCHNIVVASHGTISVRSTVGQGTTFRIRFPSSAQSSVRPPQRPSPLPQVIRRVLVVDDEPAPRETAARMLRASGLDVVVASNVEEARRYIDDQSLTLDALLTDVVLSEERGTDLLEECRKSRPETRIVVMSGYAPNPEASKKVMAVSAKFLPKPFNRQELLRALGVKVTD